MRVGLSTTSIFGDLNVNEGTCRPIHPYYQRQQKWKPVTSFWKYKVHSDIPGGSPAAWASNDIASCRRRLFLAI